MLVSAVKSFVPNFPARLSGAVAIVIGVMVGVLNVIWGGDATQVVDAPSIVEGVFSGVWTGLAATGVHEGLKLAKVQADVGDGIGGD
jgi:hypothetical protein